VRVLYWSGHKLFELAVKETVHASAGRILLACSVFLVATGVLKVLWIVLGAIILGFVACGAGLAACAIIGAAANSENNRAVEKMPKARALLHKRSM
jgi:hypothetical protein